MYPQTPNTPGNFGRNFIVYSSKDRGNSHVQLIEDGRLITDSTDIANLLNDYFINAVPRPASHMPNLQPEDFKTHPSVVSIGRKLGRQTSFSFTNLILYATFFYVPG